MALKKTYTIEIQMDAARNALADATKRLNELDAKLEGLDRNSDAAKAIIAEMAKVSKEVDGLTEEVNGLGHALDNLKPGTIGALKQQAEELEQALEGALEGSAEADALIAELGKVKAQLKDIDERVDVAFDKDRVGAYVDAINGIAGAYGVALVAAQNFGLSEQDAEKYQQQLTEIIAVVSSLEQVSKLYTAEVSQSLHGLVKDARGLVNGFIAGGEAATASGKATRAALISTGIGILIVGVGLLIANWDKLTASVKGSAKFFAELKGMGAGFFDAFVSQIKNLQEVVSLAWDGDFSGALKKAQQAGKEGAEAYKKGYRQSITDGQLQAYLTSQVGLREEIIKILKARGRDTAAEEEKQLKDRIALIKLNGEKEKGELRAAAGDLVAFREEQAKKQREEQQATELATMNARLVVLQASGDKAYNLQVRIKERELDFLKSAPQRNAAAIIAKEAEIAVVLEQARQERLQKEFDEFKKRVLETEREQLLTYEESERRKAERLAALRDELGAKIAAGTAKATDRIAAEMAERARIAAAKAPTFGEVLLMRVFGLNDRQIEKVKSDILPAVQQIYESIIGYASNVLAVSLATSEGQIAELQNRLTQLDQEISGKASDIESTLSKLETAKGARREYLLGQLARERAEEEKLRAEKAKAAREEERALKEKARLTKEQQNLEKISMAITAAKSVTDAVALGIEAGKAIAKAAAAGKFGFDNIALAIGATAALVTGILAVKGAAKSFGDGGILPGGIIKGGSHASGNDVPIFGGRVRVEGGERITPVDATEKNNHWLELIGSVGRTRALLPEDFAAAASIRVTPRPTYSQTFADGGILPSAGPAAPAPLPADTVAVRITDLATMNAYLAQIAAYTATTAAFGPPVLAIGQAEALAIEAERQSAQQVRDDLKLN